MILIYASSLLLSFFLTAKLVPLTIEIGEKYSIIDKPNKRKKHKGSLVRIGGLAIIFSLFTTLIIGLFFLKISDFEINENINIFFTLFYFIAFFLIGFADDIYELSPWLRLFFQIIIASLAFSQGIFLENLDINLLGFQNLNIPINPIFSYLITIFWLVGVPNAINWMDGLDGLASGITAISCLAFFLIGFHLNFIIFPLIAISMIGTLIGFMKYNYFPAKILMGDGGSNICGCVLSYLGILPLSSNFFEIQNSNSLYIFYYPILILGIPILDMIVVITSRILKQNSPFLPDRNHLHHRLLNNGYSDKKTLKIILFTHFLICAICSFKIISGTLIG